MLKKKEINDVDSSLRLARGQYLRSESHKRFLTPDEIYQILTEYLSLGFQLSQKPPTDSSNGSLYLFDRYKVKNFKNDSVEWIRKRGRDRIREDFVKINVHGVHKLTGFYTHEANDNTIKRRIYRLAEEGSNIHLVHYRRGAGENTIPFLSITEAMTNFNNSNVAHNIHSILPQILDFSPSYGLIDGGQKVLIVLSKPLNDKYFTPDTIMVAFGTHKAAGELISPDCVKCMSPSKDFGSVNLQIISSDGILLSVKSDDVFDYIYEESTDVQWKSGAATTTTTKNTTTTTSNGNSTSTSSSSSSGVSSSVASIDKNNTANDKDIVQRRGLGTYSFPVVSDVANANRLNIGGGLGLDKTFGTPHDQFEGDRANKIRLVERLGRGKSSQVDGYWMDDEQLRKLSDEELSSILDRQSTAVMHDLLDANVISNDLVDEFNNLDVHGHNLLHYCCLFHQIGLIPLLLARGVDTNRPTKNGFTPLHIAASLASFPIAQILITHGASLFVKDLQGMYPAQVAHMKGHSGLAKHLYETGIGLISCPPDYKSIVFDSALQTSCNFSGNTTNDYTHMDSWEMNYLGPLVHDMFENMSFTDKCALSRTLSTTFSESDADSRGSSPNHGKTSLDSRDDNASNASIGAFGVYNLPDDFSIDSIRSIVTNEKTESLQKAVALLSEDEKEALEKEATSIQASFRSWILRKNYKTLREGMAKLQTVWRISQRRTSTGTDDMITVAVTNSSQSTVSNHTSMNTGNATGLQREHEEAAIILQRAIRQVRESAVRSMSLSIACAPTRLNGK